MSAPVEITVDVRRIDAFAALLAGLSAVIAEWERCEIDDRAAIEKASAFLDTFCGEEGDESE
ncbi:MAG: hypothetical protein WC718_16920 [Phycisphaerales bacterium]|jgi:hypothetical protein